MIGGILAALIILIGYVIVPLAHKWAEKRNVLMPKLAHVEMLKTRIHAQETILTRRNALVSRLGSLLGTGPSAETDNVQSELGNKAHEESPEPASNEKNQAAKENAPETDKNIPEVGQTSSEVSLAAYVERIATKAGAKIERISPRNTPAASKGGTYFVPVPLQVKIEGNVRNVVQMLHALERGERFVRIDQIQFRRELTKGDTIDASLDITGYEGAVS